MLSSFRTGTQSSSAGGQLQLALEAALRSLGSSTSADEVLECWFEADFVVDEPVVAAVRAWADQGVTVVLATNQEHRRLAFLRERLGALLPLHAVLGSAELGAVKGDARFWHAAALRLGLDQNTPPPVLLDDDPTNVKVARSCGWGGVLFTSRDGWVGSVQQALGERGHARMIRLSVFYPEDRRRDLRPRLLPRQARAALREDLGPRRAPRSTRASTARTRRRCTSSSTRWRRSARRWAAGHRPTSWPTSPTTRRSAGAADQRDRRVRLTDQLRTGGTGDDGRHGGAPRDG